MGIIKSLFLIIIFGLAVYIGNVKAGKYVNRVKELVTIKTILKEPYGKKFRTVNIMYIFLIKTS